VKDKMKYKKLKVFDCQDMPEDVRKIFFNIAKSENDSYINWYTEETHYDWDGAGIKGHEIIDKWLIENGADPRVKPARFGEKVLINHWW